MLAFDAADDVMSSPPNHKQDELAVAEATAALQRTLSRAAGAARAELGRYCVRARVVLVERTELRWCVPAAPGVQDDDGDGDGGGGAGR